MKPTHYFFCLFLGFSLHLSTGLNAQTISNANFNTAVEIKGKVLDEFNKPFPYATVSLLNAKDSSLVKATMTADKGTYSISTDAGLYLMSVYVVGYQKFIVGPHIFKFTGKPHQLDDVQLQQEHHQLKAVNIVKQKPLVERYVDKIVINVENSAIATGNSALEILQKSPGVTVDKDGNIALMGKQGVTVMLDGKPTYLSAEQVANLLRSTEGNAVQSIELIANPSAKYDASGNSGIINIKLKKNRNYGTNGSVTGGFGYGRYDKVTGGMTFNHRAKKFNVFGNFDYGRNKRFAGTDISRVNTGSTVLTYFDQTNHVLRYRNNSNYKAGIDYFISDRHTLGFALNGYHSNGRNFSDVLTLISSVPGQIDSSVVAMNPNSFKYTGMSYNLNYKGILDTLGQEIGIDVDYSRNNGDEPSDFNNQYFNSAGQTYKPDYRFRNGRPTQTNIYAAKADYVYPINKSTKLETGLKSSIVKTDNNFSFEDFKGNGWQNDPKRSNQFLYDENINSAYLNLNRKFKTTSMQVGLRAEQTNSRGNSVTDQKLVNRHYFNFFPSIFINQELGKDHEAGLSYSRRIDRPDYAALNPFMSFLDLYSYRFGSPFLKPQYTDAFQLSYAYKKSLNISLGISRTTDVITDVMLSDTAAKTIFISKENLATQKSFNLNLSYPFKITRWWNSSNNLTTYYNQFKTPDLAGEPYESGRLAFNFNTNQTITLSQSTTLECSGYYQSRQVYGTLLISDQYSIDLGFKKSLLNKQMDIKLSANDVFKMQRTVIKSALASQNYTIRERWESQVFRVTCTYRFGSNEIKAARQRSGSADAESGRVKSGG